MTILSARFIRLREFFDLQNVAAHCGRELVVGAVLVHQDTHAERVQKRDLAILNLVKIVQA